MAELKPGHDDRMAAGSPAKNAQPGKQTKPHGDKLQKALDAISDALDENPHENARQDKSN